VARVELEAELERIAAAAGDGVAAVIPAEPKPGLRVYLCAYAGDPRTWAVLDAEGRVVTDRSLVRAAVSIAAMCELAEESAGGGKLEELRQELVSLRLTEAPEGIEEAEEAARALEHAIGVPPRVASPGHLDAVGIAARRLEHALGEIEGSPFGAAMSSATPVVDAMVDDVLAAYRGELS
jgi:hypothetical protein